MASPGAWASVQRHRARDGPAPGQSTLILDSCPVRARRGGDHTGPNPTSQAREGIKYHIAVQGNGIPAARLATAASISDTVMFKRLFLHAFAVMARIRAVFAGKEYDRLVFIVQSMLQDALMLPVVKQLARAL